MYSSYSVGYLTHIVPPIPDTSGSLYQTLGAMEGLDINMTKLQSYPIADQPFHYMFHVDMEFDDVSSLRKAVKRMRAMGVEVHIYGVYNKNTDSGIVLFNIDDIFSEDTSQFLNHYHICVRAGNHCAKMVKDEIKIKNTCRISLYLYNNKEEIDKFIEVMKGNKDIFKVII